MLVRGTGTDDGPRNPQPHPRVAPILVFSLNIPDVPCPDRILLRSPTLVP